MTIEVDELVVRAGGRDIVDRVSFAAGPGEIVAIIGPNGAGKTTLLEAIVGLRPAGGRVRFSGRTLESFSQRARTFAFSRDQVTPPAEVLVADLIDHARKHRPRAPEVLARLRQTLRVDALATRSPATLSRGEWKRVELFLALCAARPVVVLDEPFAAFDPLQLRDVLELVRWTAEAGTVVLLSVHHLLDAERVGDRFLLLASGRRVAFGTLVELRAAARLPSGSLEEIFIGLLSDKANAA